MTTMMLGSTRSRLAPDQWTRLLTVRQPAAIRQNKIHHHPFKISPLFPPARFSFHSLPRRCFVLGSGSLLIPCFVLTVIESDP